MQNYMQQANWDGWRSQLRKLGLENAVSSIIDAAGPLSILAAQSLYLVEPLFKGSNWAAGPGSLASILESPEASRQFAVFLREIEPEND